MFICLCVYKYSIFGSEQIRLKPIPLNEFHSHVKKMHEERDYGFEEEYQVCVTWCCVYVNVMFICYFRVLVQKLGHHVILLNYHRIVTRIDMLTSLLVSVLLFLKFKSVLYKFTT